MSEPTARPACDLIMKGGITSGVVYPEAVLELHKKYDFKCIGGASAGAIAAAATAAAQYGEGTASAASARAGFAGLRALNDELKQPGKLLDLFHPTREAKPLLKVFLAGLRGAHRARGFMSKILAVCSVLGALPAQVPLGVLMGGAAGFGAYALIVAWVGGCLGAAPKLAALFVLAGAVCGALLQLVLIALLVLPRQGLGICKLHLEGEDAHAEPVALTDWLFQRFDEIAGVAGSGKPLTFGDLHSKGLELQLMTTNLSELRPYVLPFENRRFLFKESELSTYLPEYALRHMASNAYQPSELAAPPGFHFLPAARDLPIAFGTRMSLSFPVLISAVPLYSVKASAFMRRTSGETLQLTVDDLKANMFSDGGICSNFPIHFFDHWLPTRPTFGISLGPIAEDQVTTLRGPTEGMEQTAAVEQRRAEPVHLPQANRPEAAAWHAVTSIRGLLGSMLKTAMSYRDTMQSELPGFRERIVEVRLTRDEGGLNLDMDPKRIAKLAAKGKEAGRLLNDRFDFDEHRWVRLQVLMPPLAENLERLAAQKSLFGSWPDANQPYRRDATWLASMTNCLDTLSGTTSGDSLKPLKRSDPRPPGALRVGPKL